MFDILMFEEKAECNHLPELLQQLSSAIEQCQRFEQPDAMSTVDSWTTALNRPVPTQNR